MATAPELPPRTTAPVRLVRAASLRPLAVFRGEVGLPVPALLTAGPGVLPLVWGGRIWEATALALGDPGVGLRVPGASPDMPLGRQAAGARTLGRALAAAACASEDHCAGQRLWLEPVGDHVWVRRCFSDEVVSGRRQANDFALRMLIDLVRRAAGRHWTPGALRLEGPAPPHAEELAALASGPVRFGMEDDAVLLPSELLGLPMPAAPPAAPEPGRLPDTGFEDSVRLAVRALLEADELTLPALAEAATTSVRTLQRRLERAGLSFAGLVEDARFEAASRLLGDPAVRVIDVAAALGYSDSANFTRAFRRWAGAPPRAFRSAAGVK